MHEHLTTPRLTLHRPVSDDLDLILTIHRDPLACVHNPSDILATRADAEALFNRWDAHWCTHGFGYWVVRQRGVPIGFTGVKIMQLQDRSVLNLLYRLAPTAWGAGLATGAAGAVVAWARRHEPNRPIIAR